MAYNIVIFLSISLMQVVILASADAVSSVSSIPGSEVHALLTFKAGIVGFNISMPQSEPLAAWNASNTHNICESWVGVTCTDSGDHVAEIDLSGYGLAGSLPPELGNLTFLSTLNLSDNSLTGGIPPQLSGCASLRALDLSSNGFSGPIPPSLGSLSALRVLDLCTNHLSGPIPSSLFTNLSSLLNLSLCANTLTGSIPAKEEAWHLASLERLRLWENNLIGLIPRSFNNCTNLRLLDLHSNKLTGAIPIELGPNLHKLDLGQNSLTGSITSSLGTYCNRTDQLEGLSSLKFLVLSENNLIGAIPPSLGRCQNLVRLFLNANKLTGPIPPELGLLHNVDWIKLDVNNLTGSIPSSLGDCHSLKDLSLFSNQLDGPIPPQLGALPALQYLHLYDNYLVGPIPSALTNCTNLTILQLLSNQLSGPIPTEFGLLQSLTYLLLSGNRLTGIIPSSLGNCSHLVYLDLQDNMLSGDIPMEMFASLQKLLLNENSLTGFGPFSLSNSSSLYMLAVAYNRLAGAAPSDLGQLQGLQYLDMSNNLLSDEIPWESLYNCSFLYYLDFSYNHLNGRIFTSSLGRMQYLRHLGLQGNLLHGTLPSFESSTQLRLFEVDLSFNSLNGSLSENLAHVLSAVQSLQVSSNHLYGALPSWLGTLSKAQLIDLSRNNFNGSMPESLSNCEELLHLDLSHNNLFGEFPLYLGSTPNLEFLDLSSNKLTGPLPLYVEDLQSLRFVNVSFNSFTGAIPLLGVFKLLNASSFLGNPGLCGPIIHKSCKSYHHHKWKEILSVSLPGAILLAVLAFLSCRHFCECLVVHENLQCFEAKRYSAEELTVATQGYSRANRIGEGALGVVYRANLSNGEVVAVKKFKDGCSRETLWQEVKILSKLRHRNLVRILGCVVNLEVVAVVLEFMCNGSVEELLHRTADVCDTLSWELFAKIAVGVASALEYMHHEYGVPVIHGDVKPSNILLDSDFEAHLADFGLAKLTTNAGATVSLSSNFKGSIGYMAPEYAYATQITTKVDVFSFGVVVLEMLTGRRPTAVDLHGMSLHDWVKGKLHDDGEGLQEVLHASLLQSISSSKSEMSLNTNDDHRAISFLRMALSCTEDHPSSRPTMQEILSFISHTQRN